MAESLLLRHQLLISSRAQRRAPNLSSFDRFVFGLWSLFVPASRIPRLAVILKPRTLLRFHEALKRRKYRWFFSSRGHRRPGPKGPSQELIDAIVEFKRRNPRVGCPRIAQEITRTFGIEIDKDVVRRVCWAGSIINMFGFEFSTRTTGFPAGSLAGEYVGASGDLGLGLGAGANVLIGGSGRTFALQPISLQGSIAVNAVLGDSALKLRPAPM